MSNSLFLSLRCSMYSVYITCVCDKLRRIGTVVERAQILTEGWWVRFPAELFTPIFGLHELRGAKNGDPHQCLCSPNCL